MSALYPQTDDGDALLSAYADFPAQRLSRVYSDAEVASLATQWAALSLQQQALAGETLASLPDFAITGFIADLPSPDSTTAPVLKISAYEGLTIDQVKGIVGEDTYQAGVALAFEKGQARPRKALVAYLDNLVNNDGKVAPEDQGILGSVHLALGAV